MTEAKQVLITYPQPQKISIPTPSEKQSNQASRTADKEPESRKREEGQESRLGHQKRDSERYPPHSRRDGPTFRRDREKEPWPGDGRQDGESKSKLLISASARLWAPLLENRQLVLYLRAGDFHSLVTEAIAFLCLYWTSWSSWHPPNTIRHNFRFLSREVCRFSL